MTRRAPTQRVAAVTLLVFFLSIFVPGFSAAAGGSISLSRQSVPVGYAEPIEIAVTGVATDFAAGDTTVTILQGETALGGMATGVSVHDAAHLRFALAPGLEQGAYTVRVRTSSGAWDAPLQVAVPHFVEAAPASTYQGYRNPVSIRITGEHTNWQQGVTTVSLSGGGATITDVAVTGPGSLSFNLGPGLPAGSYSFVVATHGEQLTFPFVVRAPSISVSPGEFTAGTHGPVTLQVNGQSTAFTPATTAFLVDGEGKAVDPGVLGVTYVSPTALRVAVTGDLAPGSYDLLVKTGDEEVAAPITVAAQLAPSVAAQPAVVGENHPGAIRVLGTNTNFEQGLTTVVLLWNGTVPVDHVQVANSGELSFYLPEGVPSGIYPLLVQTGSEQATTTLTVQPPSISLEPATIAAGEETTIKVKGIHTAFKPGITTVTLNPVLQPKDINVVSETELTFTVPAQSSGEWSVRVDTELQTAVATLTVVASGTPRLSLSATGSQHVANKPVGVRVELQTPNGDPVAADADVTVALQPGQGGEFYLSEGGPAVYEVTIAAGESAAEVLYVSATPGEAVLEAEAGGYGRASLQLSIAEAPVAGVNVTVIDPEPKAGSSINLMVTLVDEDGRAVVLAQPGAVQLSAVSAGTAGGFFTADSARQPVNALTIPAGMSSAAVAYRSTRAGDNTIQAQYKTVVDAATITVAPGLPSALSFAPESADEVTAGATAALVVRLADRYGNAIDEEVGSGGTVSASGPGEASPVELTWTGAQISFKAHKAGDWTVTATLPESSLTAAHQIRVLPAAATGLAVRVHPTEVTAYERSTPWIIGFEDEFGNPAGASGEITLSLSSSSETGRFYALPVGGQPITTLKVAAGVQSVSLFYADTTAGQPVLTASAGEGQVSTQLTVNPTVPARVALSGATSATVRTPVRLKVQVVSAAGHPAAFDSDRQVGLTATGGRFLAEADSQDPITAVTLPAGANEADVWYVSDSSGTYTLSAQVQGLVSSPMSMTVSSPGSGGPGSGGDPGSGGPGTGGDPGAGDPGSGEGAGGDDEQPGEPGSGDTEEPGSGEPGDAVVDETTFATEQGTLTETTYADGTTRASLWLDPAKVAPSLAEGDLVVDLSAVEATAHSISLPVELLAEMRAAGRSLVLRTGTADLVIPADLLAPAASGAGAQLQITVTAAPAPARAAVRNQGIAPAGAAVQLDAVLVSASGPERRVTGFERPVILSLPFAETAEPLYLGIYRLDPETGTWNYVGGRADAEQGVVSVALSSFSDYAVMAYTRTFLDVPADHWARADIQVMAARHIARGDDAGRFNPQGFVTRAEFAALMVRTLGLERVAPKQASFLDVAPTDWFYADVETAAAAGLIQGFAGEFRPRDQISRQEMAVMLARALRLRGAIAGEGAAALAPEAATGALAPEAAEALLSPLADRSAIASWAEADVALTLHLGLMKGRTESTYDPLETATRAEAVVVLKRLLVLLGEL